jgi:hypothetical protein
LGARELIKNGTGDFSSFRTVCLRQKNQDGKSYSVRRRLGIILTAGI